MDNNMIERIVKVPDLSTNVPRDDEGNMTNSIRAAFGDAAIEIGTPDFGMNDDSNGEDASDVIVNILHAVVDSNPDADIERIMERALRHFRDEFVA